MTFYSRDKNAIRVYDLLHIFFDELNWSDKKSDLYYEDGLFVFEELKVHLETGDDFLGEIYDELSKHLSPLSPWGSLSGVRPLKIVHSLKKLGKNREEIYTLLLEKYRISPKKARLLLEIEENQRDIYLKDRDKLSIYISIPFCPSICSYCNFHTKVYSRPLAEAYLKELMIDLGYAKELISRTGRSVDCIYIGGGTPWVLDTRDLEKLFSSLEDFSGLKEFTFEGGRLDGLEEKKAELVAKHVSRVCLNPQSLSPGITPLLGRPEAEELGSWIEFFRARGLKLSSDLIAGLPGESLEQFKDSLLSLIDMGPDNITIHNLSLKKGARLKDYKSNEPVGAMLGEGYDILKASGYKPYYIYRQKNMIGRGENVGYEKKASQGIYNIRMMEDSHDILSLGSNAVSKKILGDRPLRLTSSRDISAFISDKEIRKSLIDDFFE